jgi:hypothetical protein
MNFQQRKRERGRERKRTLKTMNGHCTGVGWSDGQLNFELLDVDGEKRLVAISVGSEFAVQLLGERRCIGFRAPDAESLVPCPEKMSEISGSQCPDCFEKQQILPCLRCNGDRCSNPARRVSCVQPHNHAVYLASFGPGVVKVGVARWHRRFERLAEQGARAAIIIARDDGQQVRRVESQFRFAKIVDRVQASEKLRAYTQAGTPEKLREELLTVFAMTKFRIIGQWLKEAEVVELPAIPLLDAAPRLLPPRAGFRIRGEVTAVCGQLLLIAADTGETVALEATSLVGYDVRALTSSEQGEGQMVLALA